MSAPFEGFKYLLCDNWLPYINQQQQQPKRYCEIGVFYGANILRFAELFPQATEIVGIDPWIEYEQYPEYRGNGQMSTAYETFQRNLAASPHKDKIHICRDFSYNVLPKYPDNYFDIIYIDGNHEYEFVLKDAELALQKVAVGGHIIFDDVDWPDVQKAFFTFLAANTERVAYKALVFSQTIVQRLT